jgi:hypothetical protein
MKTSFKKLTSILLAVLMLVSVVAVATVSASAASTVYLSVPDPGDGSESDYYAWTWSTTDAGSAHLLSIGDSGYYEIQLEPGTGIVFVRMPAGTPFNGGEEDWNNKWNQSEDTAYDGSNNLCTLSWASEYGGKMPATWSYYEEEEDDFLPTSTTQPTTTELPTQTVTTTPATTAPVTTAPDTTEPTENDENVNLYVSAKSNLDTTGAKVKVNGDTVTVTYTLNSVALDDGQATITYDSTKLSLSESNNTASSMFPVVTDAVYNLNAGTGKAMFNFSGTNGKYDFTGGKTLVQLVFNKVANAVGTASVYLNVTDLSSKSTTYIEDGAIKTTQGLSLTSSVTSVSPTTPPETNTTSSVVSTTASSQTVASSSTETQTKPTETEVATGDSNVKVNVSSNIATKGDSLDVDKATVTVQFNLIAEKLIAYGDFVVKFDSSKLALESRYNNVNSMFNTLSSGVTYNLNAGTGEMRFNFTGINESTKLGKFDFTKGADLIKLVFTVKSGATGDANIQLSAVDLGSIDKEYVDNSVVKDISAKVDVVLSKEEATTSATEETSAPIASGTTEATESTSATEATSVVTNPTDAPESTGNSQTTESTSATSETPATQYDYYVVGRGDLLGNWQILPSNGLTKNVDDVYYLGIKNVPAGTYEYKIMSADGTTSYPLEGYNSVVTVSSDGTKVIFGFNPTKGYGIASTNGTSPKYPTDTTVTTPSETTATDVTDTTTKPATTAPITTEPATTEPATTVAPTTQPATNATTATKGTEPSLQTVERYITNTNTDNGDVKGSTFSKLKLKATSSSNSKIKLTWTKVKGAKKYVIYGAKCGSTIKKIKTVSSSKKSLTITKLKKNQYYKYLVIAVNGTKTKGTSKVVHCTTKSSKYGNPTKVTVKKSTVNLKKGKTSTIKATFKYNKKVKKHVKLRYESSDTKVAKVSKSGKITAKKKGTCTIYVYAQNGVYKKVKVKVK